MGQLNSVEVETSSYGSDFWQQVASIIRLLTESGRFEFFVETLRSQRPLPYSIIRCSEYDYEHKHLKFCKGIPLDADHVRQAIPALYSISWGGKFHARAGGGSNRSAEETPVRRTSLHLSKTE